MGIRGAAVAVLAVGLASGCHGTFKKAAPSIGEVRTQVFAPGYPTVNLGGSYTGDTLVDATVAVIGSARSWDAQRTIQQAVVPVEIGQALEDGVAAGIGKGPPFAWTGDESAEHVLQLEIIEYGLYAPSLGMRADTLFSLRATIYGPDARRVYRARYRCEVPFGDPEPAAQALGVVNNVKQLEEMSEGEIQDTFEAVAAYCGRQFTVKMRRHAG